MKKPNETKTERACRQAAYWSPRLGVDVVRVREMLAALNASAASAAAR